METDNVLVGCLCVTRGTPDRLRNAVECYRRQTHPQLCLILVGPSSIPSNLPPVVGANVSVTVQDGPLGALRNKSVEVADSLRCKYVIQWDDDDWYADDRVSVMLSRADCDRGSILSRWLMWDAYTGNTYLSFYRPWEGSALYPTWQLLEHKYDNNLSLAEDTNQLAKLLPIRGINYLDEPELYVYCHYGTNSWNYEHFKHLYQHSELVGQATSPEEAHALHRRTNGHERGKGDNLPGKR